MVLSYLTSFWSSKSNESELTGLYTSQELAEEVIRLREVRSTHYATIARLTTDLEAALKAQETLKASLVHRQTHADTKLVAASRTIARLRKQDNETTSEVMQLREQVTARDATIAKLTADLTASRERNVRGRVRQAELTSDYAECQDQLASMIAEVARVRQQLHTTEQSLAQERTHHVDEQRQATAKVNGVQAQLDAKTTECTTVTRAKAQLDVSLKQLTSKCNEQETQLASQQRSIEALSVHATRLDADLAAARAKYAAIEQAAVHAAKLFQELAPQSPSAAPAQPESQSDGKQLQNLKRSDN